MDFTKALPENEGLPSLLLCNMMDRWENQLCHVHGYMILRHGKVIAEAYRYPYSKESKRIVHSVSKTFTATAIGIAAEEGILSLDDKIVSFFPEYKNAKECSEYLQEMTVRHLLTMTTGHEIDSIYCIMGKDKEMWQAFLEMPITYQPGTRFVYDSGATYMLSRILTIATGELLYDYLCKRLFQPLEMDGVEWDVMEEVNTGGWGACVSVKHMAKLGQLFLQKGVWNGKRILSEEWVSEAAGPQVETVHAHTCKDWKVGYGYQMWNCTREGCYRADGAFGQYILVLPPKDMTVVIWSEDAFSQDMLDAFWEEVYDKVTDEVYGVDGIAYEEFRRRCIDWAAPKLRPASCSYLEMKIQDKFFVVDEYVKDKETEVVLTNSACSINSMRFSFSGNGRLSLELKNEKGSTVIHAGNKYEYIRKAKINFEIASFIRLGGLKETEKNYAAAYEWVSDHTLKVHILWLDTAHSTDITCVFTGSQIFAVFSPSYKKFLLDVQENPSLALQELTFHGYIKNKK